ncbi:MAG: hypothetical protein IJ583_05280 [Firmicutes bacterium]|nr:hypothetical protein [Bacillota bacterium]
MLINKIKNYIIIFFVLLAVYQTGTLWFEDFSSHSFFYTFMSANDHATYEEIKYTLDCIMISAGNGEYIKRGNDIYESEYKAVFDNAVKECVTNGTYSGIKDGKIIDEVLSGKCGVYKYDYKFEKGDAAKLFGMEASKFKNIGSFDMIIIEADNNVPERMRVAFFDDDDSERKAYLFELKNNDIIKECYDVINDFEIKENELYYISSEKNGLRLFEKNVFVPKSSDEKEFCDIEVKNVFEEDGSVLLMTLEKNIDNFFDNPAIKWSSTVNNVYTYSDENTVVKYYTNGILEYSNYKNTSESGSRDFYEDYMTAISFMLKDTNIKNEYYLSGYKKDSDKTIFEFNYKINDMPIIMSDDMKNETGMENMIEVTVSGGNVSKYKRVAYIFEENKENNYFVRLDFLGAVDKVLSIGDNEGKTIRNMNIAYEIEREKSAKPKWVIDIEGNIYTENAG